MAYATDLKSVGLRPLRVQLPPSAPQKLTKVNQKLTNDFFQSRRDGLSPETLKFYRGYLNLSESVIGIGVSGQQITQFISTLQCSSAGKHAYYRTLRAFYNWLYSPKSGYGFKAQNNPMLMVDSPKVQRKILPSLTAEQVSSLINQAESVRDKAIISLFCDSGLRLSEVVSIKPKDIDWDNRLIKVWCKGNKEGLAPFGDRTESLLREWLFQYQPNGNLWGIHKWGIVRMLNTLKEKTGLKCNAHTFRRSFATILANSGVDSIHIMRLGRWESIQMVERYTRSVTFEDSMKHYRAPLG